MAAGGEIAFVFYRYDPSKALAIIFVILFALTSAYHAFQLTKYRTWYFIPFFLGGICQTLGYAGRLWSSSQTPLWTKTPFIIQSLLILIAPALFAASIYMTLSRIILSQSASHLSPIPPRWLTKIFVACDILSFMMQGAGGGLLAMAESAADFERGEQVIIGGLFVQITAFALFVVTSAIFHVRLMRKPTPESLVAPQKGERRVKWQVYMTVLYIVSLLIFVRSVFRVVEYLEGYEGHLQSKEYYLYIFDAVLMFLAMAVLNVWHPSKIVSGKTGGGKAAGGTRQDLEMGRMEGMIPLSGNGTATDLGGSEVEMGSVRKGDVSLPSTRG